MPDASGTFTLRIRFIGLCFFLPKPDDGFLHVLLPRTTGDHPHDAPPPCEVDDEFQVGRHQALLLYHPAYAAGSTANPNQPAQPERVDLTNVPRALVLEGVGGGGRVPGLPPGVLNLHELFNERTRPELHANPVGPPHRDLAGRISLPAGRFNDRKPGARWEIRGPGAHHDAVEMSPIIEYAIENIPGPTLPWRVFPNAGPAVPALEPRNGEMELYIYHGPAGHVDRPPAQVPVHLHQREPHRQVSCAWHVAAFYPLLGTRPPWKKPIPKFKRHPDPLVGGEERGPAPLAPVASVSVYTCMNGGGEP